MPDAHDALVDRIEAVIQERDETPIRFIAESVAQDSEIRSLFAQAGRRAVAQEIAHEAEARQHPPHLDGNYRTGIWEGLRLAERIATETPDEHPDADFPDDPGSVNVHRYPSCRIADRHRLPCVEGSVCGEPAHCPPLDAESYPNRPLTPNPVSGT